MDLMNVIRARCSVRKYRPEVVPEEKIEKVLEAARLAPSWANGQCWTFIVVTDPKVKLRLTEGENAWVGEAPVVIAACADPKKSGEKKDQGYYLVDIGIAMEHLVLAATELGLATCWIGWFDEAKAKSALGVPKEIRVVALTPLGYADETPEERPRRALSEIVYREQWG
jgi:nitroreductase